MPRTSTAADTQPSATLFRDPTLRKKKVKPNFWKRYPVFSRLWKAPVSRVSCAQNWVFWPHVHFLGNRHTLIAKFWYSDSLVIEICTGLHVWESAYMHIFVVLSHIVSHAGVTLSSKFSHHSWINGTIICVHKFYCYHADIFGQVLPQRKNTFWLFTVLSTSWVLIALYSYQVCLSVKSHCRSWRGYM